MAKSRQGPSREAHSAPVTAAPARGAAPGDAPQSATTAAPADRGASRLWGVIVALAALYPIAYMAVAIMRMGYPFELEWMEGGTLGHIHRILAGQPLYVEPSLAFTPFTYPPLYFYAGAALSKLLGVGFVPLRLLSFVCSLGVLTFTFLIVRGDTRRTLPAVLAACLFAASYREGGAWLDLARVDSMYLMFMAAGVWLVRLERPWLAGALGGLAFALAALTKQSALFIALPVALALLVADWKRGVAFTAVVAAVAGGASLALDAASGGWYRFYVFELPRHHPIIPQLLRGFWTSDLLGTFAISLAIGLFRFCVTRHETRRRDAVDAVLLASLILTAYATRIRVGGFTNLLMPAHFAAALALGWGLGALLDFAGALPARGRGLERFVVVLCLVQFALCAYKPWRQLPPAADLVAGRQFVESLRRVPGDVWIPSHPYLAEMAGKTSYAHELSLTDVLRPGDTPQHRKLMDALRAALREHRYDLVILDDTGWLKDETEPYYDHAAQMFGNTEGELFWPITGYRTRPNFVWAPKQP